MSTKGTMREKVWKICASWDDAYDLGKEEILALVESEVERGKGEVVEQILDKINEIADKEAAKWEHEQTWKQPYAGNRVRGVGFEVRKVFTPQSSK